MNLGLPPAARAYLAALTLAALLATGVLLLQVTALSPRILGLMVLFIGTLGVAYRHPLLFARRVRLYLDTAVILAAILLLAPGLAALVAAVGPLVAYLSHRDDLPAAVFNSAQSALQAIAGGLVLAAAGWGASDRFDDPRFVLIVPLVAGAIYLVNTFSVAAMVALQQHGSLLASWQKIGFTLNRTEALAHLAQLGLGVLVAVVVDVHAWALALLILPAVVVYSALDHNARLRLRAEERLVHQAFHDSLTDLPNRSLFLERLQAALTQTSPRPPRIAVLFLDLDLFKLVNDSLGHEAGDRLLVEVAARLRASVRPGDTLARLGGDEFTILLEDMAHPSDAVAIAGRIAESLAAPYVIHAQRLGVTASIGIVLIRPDHGEAAEVLREADVALYRAKAGGRDRFAVFVPGMDAAVQDRTALESDLHQAIERNELRLDYQPRVNLATGRIVAVEALVRWAHPERGLLSPDAFLPIAEESGLILPIGRWVLEQACQQANAWKRQFGQLPTLSINLSARQLQDPSLVDDITRGLRDAGLEPTDLKVEIAEHAAMIDPDRAVTALWQLQRLGVRIAIDDFGAGFSSLSHLGRLPVDTLQLDRMFVAELDRSREATAIAEAVIMLAHTLSLTVVAEGIERATQVEHLRGLGCELGQGDYFCEPLPGDVIGRLLAVSPDMPLTADPGSPGVPTVAP